MEESMTMHKWLSVARITFFIIQLCLIIHFSKGLMQEPL